MNARDINDSKYILEELIDKALLDSFVWIIKRCGGKPQELDYVAALSTKFIKNLFNILVAVFPDYDFFCHKCILLSKTFSKYQLF